MRRMRLLLLLLMVSLLLLPFPAYAELLKIGTASYDSDGNGTPEEYNLIHMEDGPFGPITWLDYTNGYATWGNQVAWASGLGTLEVTLNAGYSLDQSAGWRLPETVDGPWEWGYDGTTTGGYKITSSEMGYLFYEELGNKGYYDTDGNYQPGYGLINTSYFNQLQSTVYWSGTEYSAYPGNAWVFDFSIGGQGYGDKDGHLYGLAVLPGDVSAAVPEPATMLLLGSGLAGLGVFRRKFKKS